MDATLRLPSRWAGVVFRAGLIIVFLWLAWGLLVPIALGAVFALLLFPCHRWLNRALHERVKPLSPLLVTLACVVLVLMPLAFVIGEAWNTVNIFLGSDPSASVDGWQNSFLQTVTEWARSWNIDATSARQGLTNMVRRAAEVIAGFLTTVAASVPSYVVDMFLFTVALYYFLRDGEDISLWLKKVLPFRSSEKRELFKSIRTTVHGAILGTIVTAFVQGGLAVIAYLIFGIPGAFLFGLIAAFSSFIPVVGTFPVTIGGCIYLLANGRWGAAIGMLAAAFIIGTSDNIVRPWVQSGYGKIHPLLGLISIFGGLQAFGPFGIFLGPVLGAMALWTLDTYGSLRRPHRAREQVSADVKM